MYTVKVRSKFSSAHNLRGYKGKCEELHGHNWRVEVCAGSEEPNEMGMVVDFTDLKQHLSSVMSDLDHKYLNDIPPFDELNPTSENIAKYIFERIQSVLGGIKVCAVTVWETDTASATYSE